MTVPSNIKRKKTRAVLTGYAEADPRFTSGGIEGSRPRFVDAERLPCVSVVKGIWGESCCSPPYREVQELAKKPPKHRSQVVDSGENCNHITNNSCDTLSVGAKLSELQNNFSHGSNVYLQQRAGRGRMRVSCDAMVCKAFLWAGHLPGRPRTLTAMALLATAPGAVLANSFAVTQGTWGTSKLGRM